MLGRSFTLLRARVPDLGALLGFSAAAMVAGVVCALLAEQWLALVKAITFVLVGILFVSRLARSAPVWVRLSFGVVGLNLVLGSGFANLAFGVGSVRASFGELLVLVGVVSAVMRYPDLLFRPFLVASLLCASVFPLLFHLSSDINTYGISAARDALHQVDMLAVLIGIATCRLANESAKWFEWRRSFWSLLLIGSALYYCALPFQETLVEFSPRVFGFQQYVPIFGHFTLTPAVFGLMAITVAPSQTLPVRLNKVLPRALLGLVYLSAAVLIQSRGFYIFLVLSLLILVLWGYFRETVAALGAAIFISCIMLSFEASDFEVPGRVGKVSLTTTIEQLVSISGGSEGLQSQANGVRQRRQWREQSLGKWSEAPATTLFGIGYGQALTDLQAPPQLGQAPVLVREPHNSYVSVLTRTGVVGALGWLLLAVIPIIALFAERTLGAIGRKRVDRRYADLQLLCLLYLLFTAWVQPVFESPYSAIPFYFILGTIIADSEVLRASRVDRGSRDSDGAVGAP